MKDFAKLNAVIYGISPDKPAAQKKFEADHSLRVPLLCDVDKAVTTAYGAFGKKMMYGREVQGIIRSTFLIDPKGKLARVWPNVKVDGHAEAVLVALKELAK